MKTSVPKILFSLMLGLFICSTLLTEKAAADGVNNIGVKIMEKEAVGQYLADSNGMTLYRFTRDEKNISHCMEGCADNWPPFHIDPAAAVEGCESGDFAAITREDGREQTTYKGIPLYQFINDKYPGDIFGQGIGGVWFIVTP